MISSTNLIIVSISIAIACVSVQQKRLTNEFDALKRELLDQQVLHQPDRNHDDETHQYRSSHRILKVAGAVGDGVTDDTRAIQRAINQAARNKSGGTVVLQKGTFLITKSLRLKGGVTLVGQGYGSSPLAIQFDAGGSVLAYCGTDYAVRFQGHGSSLERVAVYDWNYPAGSECETLQAKGGVIASADASGLESITMRNVLIYQFMGGSSLTLESKNQGGIAYASFENLRIRHAKVGIHLSALDELSFVNSNTFHDGAISGGITDVAILATGPGSCNDNQFNGMVIEPPSTSIAHVHVSGKKTNIRMNDVRLEGTAMPLNKPLVIIEDDSYGNVMNGMIGHTFVQADLNRNPEIEFTSNKMVGLQPPPYNLFWNAAFHSLVGTQLPGWTLPGTNFQVTTVPSIEQEPLYENHNILQVTYVDDGQPFKMSPQDLPSSPIHSFCSFGIYAQSSVSGSIVAAMKYESGSIISSAPHTGSGKWEFIGMSSLYDRNNGPLPYFSITGNVNLTAPTFVYGSTPVSPGAELMSSSGAKMSGLLTLSTIEFTPPTGDRWSLPLEGNLFNVQPFLDSGGGTCSTSYVTVRRINNPTGERFPKGSIITILFPACGECVPCLKFDHSGYIELLGGSNFAPDPSSINSSITLMSGDFGTWKEVSRNEV